MISLDDFYINMFLERYAHMHRLHIHIHHIYIIYTHTLYIHFIYIYTHKFHWFASIFDSMFEKQLFGATFWAKI